MAPRQPSCSPRWPKMAPNWPNLVPRWTNLQAPEPDSYWRKHYFLCLSKTTQDTPQSGQNLSKMAPTWPKCVSRWPKVAPRWPQNGFKTAFLLSKMAPRRPKMAQNGPKMAFMLSKIAHPGSKTAFLLSKMAPRWPKLPPRWPEMVPKWLSRCCSSCLPTFLVYKLCTCTSNSFKQRLSTRYQVCWNRKILRLPCSFGQVMRQHDSDRTTKHQRSSFCLYSQS